MLVHLTTEGNSRAIVRNGIKYRRFRWHDVPGGIFCMPHLASYYVSHQWLRELKRRGEGTLVGVDFRLPSTEKVWFGRYNGPHIELPLGRAVKVLLEQTDQRGHEFIVPRSISPEEIIRVRRIPQVVGWRFSPGAKGARPFCACDACSRGDPFRKRIFAGAPNAPTGARPPPKAELLQALHRARSEEALIEALSALQGVRRGAPEDLHRFMSDPRARVRSALAETLRWFRGPAARRMLLELADDGDPAVREAAVTSLLEAQGWSALTALRALAAHDPAIRRLLDAFIDERNA
jgi:hypothetical protein